MTDIHNHPLPPTPPLPVYSQAPVRSQSPQLNTDQPTISRSNGTGITITSGNKVLQSRQDIRPSISMSPAESEVVNGFESSVHVHPPEPQQLEHAQDMGLNSALSPQQMSRPDPTRLSPSPQAVPRRKPLDERNRNISENSHRRIVSDSGQFRQNLEAPEAQGKAMRHVSTSILPSDEQIENFQPLQYHHQIIADAEMQAIEKRASKMTIGTLQSDGSTSTGQDNLNPGYVSVRNSVFGRALQRPDSGFSSTSDQRGRDGSPGLSPTRPISRHSRSPDTRPLSYIDLLNVPYPQQVPGGTENLVNSQLRAAVGTNASLLSTRKTLDMYRANVKKTNDPAIQYEFAVFMVSAAQEEGLDLDAVSESAVSDRSQLPSTREDLLKEAKQILSKLCDRSYPFAQYYLADGYASGLFNKGREDWDRAFPLFLAAAKHGHAEAGYRTALCYEFGWGTSVNAMKAVQFYQHAASKNHPGAMLRLGRACLMGDMGLTKRYREGVRWLSRAAESADYQYNQAPFDLGSLYETGYGPDVFKDESYAAQLFTKAADLGHAEANFRLGEAYEFGQLSCPKDPALSIHFYTGAAERNHAAAQMALCAWYMIGVEHVLEKDEHEAYEWARRSAENGLPKAQYTVGYFTEMGIGCRRDPLEANVWYVRAADQGEERAKHRIAAIRAAATGADPLTAAVGGKDKPLPTTNGEASDKKKRFGLF